MQPRDSVTKLMLTHGMEMLGPKKVTERYNEHYYATLAKNYKCQMV